MNVTSVKCETIVSHRAGRPFRRRFLVILLGTFLGAIGFWTIDQRTLGLFHDDGIYVVVGKSLSEGSGYRIISLPHSAPQTKYPFVYPYVLSWVWTFHPSFPDNIFVLKAINVVVIAALFYLTYLFFIRSTGRAGSEPLCYAMLICTNRIILSLMNFTISDLLFLLFAVLVITLYGSCEPPSSKLRDLAPFAALSALAYLIRPAGAPLIIAGAIYFLWSRRYRDLLCYVCIVAILVFPWIVWQSIAVSGSDGSLFDYYVSHNYKSAAFVSIWSKPSQAIDLVAANLRYLVESFDFMLLLGVIPGLNVIMYSLAALGLWVSLRKHNPVFWCFVFMYTCLVVSWPFHPLRYALPLTPVMMLFLFRGAQRIEELVRDRVKVTHGFCVSKLAWLPLTVIMILNSIWVTNRLLKKETGIIRGAYGQPMPYEWEGFAETFEWVRNHTEATAVLATAYDPMYYLYTGRKAIRPALHKPETYFYPYGKATPDVGSASEITQQLAAMGVAYLIIDPLDGYLEKDAELQLFEELIRSKTSAELVFTSVDLRHRVYALRHERIAQND